MSAIEMVAREMCLNQYGMLRSADEVQGNNIPLWHRFKGEAEGVLDSRWLVEHDRAVAEAAWDEAIAAARSVLARRSPQHYETDIDLIVEPNPHSQNALVVDPPDQN